MALIVLLLCVRGSRASAQLVDVQSMIGQHIPGTAKTDTGLQSGVQISF